MPAPTRPPPFDPSELSALRSQVAAVRAAAQRSGTFRGFRSVTVGFSAVAAVAAAWADRAADPPVFPGTVPLVVAGFVPVGFDVGLWVGAAGLCLTVAGGEMLWRTHGSPYGLAMTRTAAGQFLPCVAAGAAVTGAVTALRGDLLPTLPGLWALLFGLGVCSCARLLPRAFWAVGAWYLAAGVVGVAAPRVGATAGYLGVTFGAGQAVTAGLLYLLVECPERRAGRPEGWGEEDPAEAHQELSDDELPDAA